MTIISSSFSPSQTDSCRISPDAFTHQANQMTDPVRVAALMKSLQPLTRPYCDEQGNIVLLKQAGKRISEKMINSWSIHFLAEVEEMVRDSKIEKFSSLKEMISNASKQPLDQVVSSTEELLLKLFFLNQEQEIIKSIDEELNGLKVAIKRLFDKLSAEWDKSLDIHGFGIIDYLGQLLGIQLLSVYHQSTDLKVI